MFIKVCCSGDDHSSAVSVLRIGSLIIKMGFSNVPVIFIVFQVPYLDILDKRGNINGSSADMSEKMNFRRSMRGFRYSMRGYTLMAALLCIAGLLFFVAYNDLLSSPWTSVVNMFQNINTQVLNSHHHHHHHHHHLDLPSLDEIKAKQAQAQAQASSVMTFTTKAPKIAEKKEFFGIMFDAGSTGSRIHVFKFTPGEKGK